MNLSRECSVLAIRVLALFLLAIVTTGAVLSSQAPAPADKSGPVEQHPAASTENKNSPRPTQGAPSCPRTIIKESPADVGQTKSGPRENDTGYELSKGWHKFWTTPEYVFSAAVALFTAALFGVGWWQGHQLRRTVNEMRESNRLTQKALAQSANTQRAWLVPEEWVMPHEPDPERISLLFVPEPDRPCLVSVPFRNIGQVPAIGAALTGKARLERVHPEGKGGVSELTDVVAIGRKVVGKDQTHSYDLVINLGPQEIIDGIHAWVFALSVSVEMIYGDTIGTKGRTAFSMIYNRVEGSPGGVFSISGTYRTFPDDSIME